jgi:hypothetical protein
MKDKPQFDKETLLKILKLIKLKIRKMLPSDLQKNWVKELNMRTVVKVHAIVCMFLGTFAALAPKRLAYDRDHVGEYNHMAHEFVRLYGCLTIAIGWFVWTTKKITDGRIVRAISEVFALAYILQALVMLRAQFTNPRGHSFFHWMVALVFTAIGAGYTLVRLGGRIKDFSLPYDNDAHDE